MGAAVSVGWTSRPTPHRCRGHFLSGGFNVPTQPTIARLTYSSRLPRLPPAAQRTSFQSRLWLKYACSQRRARGHSQKCMRSHRQAAPRGWKRAQDGREMASVCARKKAHAHTHARGGKGIHCLCLSESMDTCGNNTLVNIKVLTQLLYWSKSK